MTKTTFQTTNDIVDKVLQDIAQLIQWADADIQHATEMGYKSDRKDAMYRLNKLTAAENAMKEAIKY